MVKLFIDDIPVEAEAGKTILQAAEQVGIHIPHFCYFPAFQPEGTCRMCLVEIEGLPKLELACSTLIKDGMKIFSKSEKVITARKGVLEFLLAEHPLDCPICDQAGDCTLQDYYEEYGFFENQFLETKDKHEKKNFLGKNLIHDQERCILCRRCVRFLQEVTGTGELGVFERSAHTEINTFPDRPVNNNYSGNLAQICPVGAITDIDFRFQTRSWFLNKGESICPFCSRGCKIVIEYHRGFSRFKLPKRVYRFTAGENPAVNNYWICDLGRYGYADLNENRVKKITFSGEQKITTYAKALPYLAGVLRAMDSVNKPPRISLILNSRLTNEELFLIKKIFQGDIRGTRIYFLDPEPGEKDDLLLTEDRVPNKYGVQEIGIKSLPFDLAEIQAKTDVLIIFGTYLEQCCDFSELSACFAQISDKILITPQSGKVDELADLILPSAQIGEKAGSLTNFTGLVQHFSAAMDPLGAALPEWKILLGLAQQLKLNLKYYNQFSSPEDIFQQMEQEISFFGNKSE